MEPYVLGFIAYSVLLIISVTVSRRLKSKAKYKQDLERFKR